VRAAAATSVYTFPDGIPTGQVGIYSNMAGVQFGPEMVSDTVFTLVEAPAP